MTALCAWGDCSALGTWQVSLVPGVTAVPLVHCSALGAWDDCIALVPRVTALPFEPGVTAVSAVLVHLLLARLYLF